jgi:hypothetical protein
MDLSFEVYETTFYLVLFSKAVVFLLFVTVRSNIQMLLLPYFAVWEEYITKLKNS